MSAEERDRSSLLPTLGLLGVTAVFGWTFVVVKVAIASYPVLPFLGIRFALAALLLLILLRTWPGRVGWKAGLPAAVALAVGYLLQTEGMLTVSPGVAGLLTGLFVVFTPVIDRVFFGARLRWQTLASILVALGGTVLLTQGAGLNVGDLLVAAAALAFATQIVLLSHGRGRVVDVSLVQMLFCAGCFLVLGGLPHLSYPPLTAGTVVAAVITGCLASALAVLVQTWAQRRMTASRAGLVLAAEPGFALLFGVMLAGERLGPLQLAGAFVILAAILGHELFWRPGPA